MGREKSGIRSAMLPGGRYFTITTQATGAQRSSGVTQSAATDPSLYQIRQLPCDPARSAAKVQNCTDKDRFLLDLVVHGIGKPVGEQAEKMFKVNRMNTRVELERIAIRKQQIQKIGSQPCAQRCPL